MKMHVRHAFGAALLAASFFSQAAPLISEKEAKLPAGDAGTMATRAITRGPGIRVLAPEIGATTVRSPFLFKLAFEPRGGARIDPATVKIVYIKTPNVDLLDRVKAGLTEKGIELNAAEAPAGEHQIRVTVQDSEGRQTSQLIGFTVVK